MTLAERVRAAIAVDPGNLLTSDDVHPKGLLVPAAVLIAIVDGPRPALLLTERKATLRRHAGQVAFPGGRIDPEDAGAEAAALREAQEEVGLDPAAVTLLGSAGRYVTGTGYDVAQIVGLIAPGLPLAAREDEVESIFEAPLDHLLDAANHRRASGLWQGAERHFFEIDWDGHRIWGATAAMIVNLSRRLAFA